MLFFLMFTCLFLMYLTWSFRQYNSQYYVITYNANCVQYVVII